MRDSVDGNHTRALQVLHARNLIAAAGRRASETKSDLSMRWALYKGGRW
jgi:hypothetical protein